MSDGLSRWTGPLNLGRFRFREVPTLTLEERVRDMSDQELLERSRELTERLVESWRAGACENNERALGTLVRCLPFGPDALATEEQAVLEAEYREAYAAGRTNQPGAFE